MNVKIASAQYDIGFLGTWTAYHEKVERWVAQAVAQDAKILVFPEYASMELASLFKKEVYSSLSGQLKAMQGLLDNYLQLFQVLAWRYHCIIQSGSFPIKMPNGEYRNRAYLFLPNGTVEFQDKLTMTRFENEHWHISSGEEIKCFNTEFGKLAIAICYDSEFPLLCRRQVEMGADLILVPSCTDTVAGYHRVKIGCQARALENQCYVVQSPLVGNASWSEAVDINIGAAAIYTPVDRGFPDNGILAMGEFNAVQWVYADINLDNIKTVRQEGQVFNYRDWELQKRFV
ncbi:MAG: carbon-nitrogen hydrolase family protein [Methylococcaceae bacterium]